MEHKRLVLITDGVLYECCGKYYVSGPADLSIFRCFEGISEIIIWTRIYTIDETQINKYSKYDLSEIDIPIRFCGIYNQKPGLRGYLLTMHKRIYGIGKILDKPCVVYGAFAGVSAFITYILYGRRDWVFISRTIGDPAKIGQLGMWYGKMGQWLAVHFSKKSYKRAILQTWVSKELERKYAIPEVPSIVFHDCQITNEQICERIKIRLTKTLHLIFVGRLSPEKGILDILEALKKINCKEIKLKIVGQGRQESEIKKWVTDNHMDGVVELCGVKPWGEELWQEMREADCLLLPSYNEGLGMVLLEAMSCGIPVIASNVGGIPDIVEDGFNGLLIEPGNIEDLKSAICTLYNDEGYRRQLAEGALEVVRKNTREAQQEKFKQGYRKYVREYI